MTFKEVAGAFFSSWGAAFYTAATVSPAWIFGWGCGLVMMVTLKLLIGMKPKERSKLWLNAILSTIVPLVCSIVYVSYTKDHPHVFFISFTSSLGGTAIALHWDTVVVPMWKYTSNTVVYIWKFAVKRMKTIFTGHTDGTDL